MKALIQRVLNASVKVEGRVVGEIGPGILLFLGIEKHDGEAEAARLVEKVLGYRIFENEEGRMDLSLIDLGLLNRDGGLLVVSQFTLVADTRKGKRPSFSSAADPDHGRKMYERFIELARERLVSVETGSFGADMKISLLNDGPVTFLLEV